MKRNLDWTAYAPLAITLLWLAGLYWLGLK